MSDLRSIPLGEMRADPDLQPRATLDLVVLAEYATAMSAGVEFPPVVAFFDGETYWLADGFHRYHAADRAGMRRIATDVRSGGRREAILHGVGSNADHGLRRTNEDKRRAVEMLFADPEWAAWSDSEIARRCNVDHKTVAAVRADHLGNSQDAPPSPRLVERNGTTYRMDTARIGAREPASVQRVADDVQARSLFERVLEDSGGDVELRQTEIHARFARAVFAFHGALVGLDPAEVARASVWIPVGERERVNRDGDGVATWLERYQAARAGGLRLISTEDESG